MLEYHDKIIFGIAGSVTELLIGSAVATVFIYHAMFRNPPLPSTDPIVALPAVVWHVVLVAILIAVIV